MDSPGNNTSHHDEKESLPSFNKLPQVTTSNGTPTPINDSDDSTKTAPAIPNKS